MCASDATVTILAGALSKIRGSRSNVNSACPKWFVPMCISYPSSVVPRGAIMIPALFMRMWIFPSLANIRVAQSRTDCKLPRSSFSIATEPLWSSFVCLRISSFAFSVLARSRHAKMTRAPKINKIKTRLSS